MAQRNRAEDVQITSDGIRNSLKKYTSLDSVAEYVWNGFDAGATKIDIVIETAELSSILKMQIIDNGSGIDRNYLAQKFKPFYQSDKIYDPNDKHSSTHGKNGVGRLTFFTFATHAQWDTVFSQDEKKYVYVINVNTTNLQQYTPSDLAESNSSTGTTVTFENIFDAELSTDTIRFSLAKEFCWFLELHKHEKYSITINGKELEYSHLIIKNYQKEFVYEATGVKFIVDFVCWNTKLDEYSRYYYIKSNGNELAKETTKLNQKGDKFYHSIFIRSAIFDDFDINMKKLHDSTLGTRRTKQSPEYIYIMQEVNQLLIDERRPFLKEYVSKVIEDWDVKSAFPYFDPKNHLDIYKTSQIEDLIANLYIVQPKIFSGSMNKEHKKTFIRLLDLTMQSGEIDSLFQILEEILEMDSVERQDLAEILKYTKMSNITKTIRLIKDRYQAIDDLKTLVYNADLNANEVHHIQKFIENHYWLFGEEYALVTAAEPNFEEALRRYLHILHKEYSDKTVTHPDRLKQMDIFAVRQYLRSGRCDNIVVELKHPDVPLGESQLSQVKEYMRVIQATPEFNNPNAYWNFYLIGNRFNNNGYIQDELESHKTHGEPSLVHNKGNTKIYVKTWSEIFDDFEVRYNHITRTLELERQKLQREFENANDVVAAQENNTATSLKEYKVELGIAK